MTVFCLHFVEVVLLVLVAHTPQIQLAGTKLVKLSRLPTSQAFSKFGDDSIGVVIPLKICKILEFLKSLHFQLWWVALFFLCFIEAVLYVIWTLALMPPKINIGQKLRNCAN